MRRRLRRNRTLQIGLILALALVTALVIARVAAGASSAPTDDRPVAAFIGDADTQGTGATSPKLRWTSLVAKSQGWREVNFGRASTGYATSSTARLCGHPVCPPYAQLVDQVAAINPDIVVVSGGQSDWLAWQTNPDRTAGLIDTLLDTLKERVPKARIVVVSPAQPPGAAQEATVDQIAAHVQAAAEARKLTYVDLLKPNVLGKGADVVANRFDPSDAGHRAIADRVERVLA